MESLVIQTLCKGIFVEATSHALTHRPYAYALEDMIRSFQYTLMKHVDSFDRAILGEEPDEFTKQCASYMYLSTEQIGNLSGSFITLHQGCECETCKHITAEWETFQSPWKQIVETSYASSSSSSSESSSETSAS